MSKRLVLLAVLALIAVVLCTAPMFANPNPVAFNMTYYSDSSHTVQVGECHYVSCQQWASSGEPKCSGTLTDFVVYSNYVTCWNTIK